MNPVLKTALSAAMLAISLQAAAQITFYEDEGFRGRTFSSSRPIGNFDNTGFNDRASSVIVDRGRWEVCENAAFQGRCVVLRKGSYESLKGMGMNNRVSSMRPVQNRANYANEAPEPLLSPGYEYRRRPNERMFEAPVTNVRAVVGAPNQRCWIERQQVSEPSRSGPNVGRGVAGALIGGILGHQVGGGLGRDLATLGGAVAGGAIGANSGRNGSAVVDRDVKRCETVASTTPAYWDVTYVFRGTEHHTQMSTPPGQVVAVNANGEPRL